MKIKLHRLKRAAYIVAAMILVVATVMDGFFVGRAYAIPSGGQVSQRAIRMSTSAAGATSTTYLVSFRPATAHTITGIVLDFCNSSSTPLIGDSTCTAPSNFSVGAPTVDETPGETGFTDLGGTWTPTSANSGRTLKMTSSGVAVNTSTTYAFNISTITNQDVVGTFYARFITYTGSTAGGTEYANYAPGTEGSSSATDYGGFALSTANQISITAKVPETLTFCVSGANPTTDCGGTTAPSLTLGHGTNNILDSTAVDTNAAAPVYTQLSTNANGGSVIRMKNSAASGGLNFGSNSIPPTGESPVAIVAGTAAFGVRVANVAGGTGTTTVDANYSSATDYGMDHLTAPGDATSVLTLYGDPVISAALPINAKENTFIFAATASNTTPAGIYTATITLIATGTF